MVNWSIFDALNGLQFLTLCKSTHFKREEWSHSENVENNMPFDVTGLRIIESKLQLL